jgi:hypothetical protein
MAIVYYNLGASRKVNETVFAGSHDAAITSGGGSTKTQSESIIEQARCGVRIFDIRISGQRTPDHGAKLSAFHGSNTPVTKTKNVGGVQRPIEVTKMVAGHWGLDLDVILDECVGFLRECPSEFLILKFDKSSNYEMILEACRIKLKTRLYTTTGNIADKSLADMAGKVVCGFMGEGYTKLWNANKRIGDGVAQIVNLYSEPTQHNPNINGLMYYGKGGTSVTQPKPFAAPVKGKYLENIEKQSRILNDANANYGTDVLRMMYWTQTGFVRSIESRDKMGWTPGATDQMKQLWAAGAYDHLNGSVPLAHRMNNLATPFEVYLPNFILIDFANQMKGQTIYDLNTLPRSAIIALNQQMSAQVQQRHVQFAPNS